MPPARMVTPKLWTFEVKTNIPREEMIPLPSLLTRVFDSHKTFDLEIRHGGELVMSFKGATEMEMWAKGVEELKEALLRANGEDGEGQ